MSRASEATKTTTPVCQATNSGWRYTSVKMIETSPGIPYSDRIQTLDCSAVSPRAVAAASGSATAAAEKIAIGAAADSG